MEEEDIVKKWNKVGYYYDETIGCYNYYNSHPMKPFRVAMTDSLIKAYKMDTKMTSFVKTRIKKNRLKNFLKKKLHFKLKVKKKI